MNLSVGFDDGISLVIRNVSVANARNRYQSLLNRVGATCTRHPRDRKYDHVCLFIWLCSNGGREKKLAFPILYSLDLERSIFSVLITTSITALDIPFSVKRVER